MRNVFVFVVFFFFLSSCAIRGDVYRLQTRINCWYSLLGNELSQLFVDMQFEELGHILDLKEENDAKFAKKFRQVKVGEAIMAFSGEQTAHFFYNIVLRDLVKFSYIEFLNVLTVAEQTVFVTTKRFDKDPFLVNSKVKEIFQRARMIYGMEYFSDIEILNYYREKSLPAMSYPVVYDILVFLARYRSLEFFLEGDVDRVLNVFSIIDKSLNSHRIATRKQAEKDKEMWLSLRSRFLLSECTEKEFLRLIKDHILVEMDQKVLQHTLTNIRARFKE